MKNKLLISLTLCICICLCATLNSFAQLKIDKQLQMTGASNSDKQITGVGDPTSADHAVNVQTLQKGTLIYANETGSANAYLVILNPAPVTPFTAGMIVNFKASNANTGASTLNVNGTIAPITKQGLTALTSGDILAGQVVTVMYDGSNFQMQSSSGTSNINGTTNNLIKFTGSNTGGNSSVYDNGNSVGVGTNSPDPSAKLDVSSTTQGMLIPRMSTSDRNAITGTIPQSLMIFNTTTKCMEIYVDGLWQSTWCSCPITYSVLSAGTHVPSTTQIVWNWNTVSGATGYKWNTINNYETATNNGTSISYTQPFLNSNTAYTLYVWAYNTCGNTTVTPLQATTTVFTCGNIFTVTHIAGTVAPVTKTVNYGTVTTSLSGASKCWITQNLGSSNQASSVTDATEASAGWYWQFNRKQGYKHDGTTRTPNTAWIDPIIENSNWIGSNDPCTIELGTGWRIPTTTEWNNAVSNGAWSAGYAAPYSSVLKIHAAGRLRPGGALADRGSIGYPWASTTAGESAGGDLFVYISQVGVFSQEKKDGNSVRCIKD